MTDRPGAVRPYSPPTQVAMEIKRFHQAECSCGWAGTLFEAERVDGTFPIGRDPFDQPDTRAVEEANNHIDACPQWH